MSLQTSGIHHITAIVGDPQQNYSFYTQVLGLRLVKKTVNFDQPDVYHLYYGNEIGEPGTLLTFFPLLKGLKRRASEVSVTSFAVPQGSFSFWQERLASYQLNTQLTRRFGQNYLSFKDPHGLTIELVEKELSISPWLGSDIPARYAIRGFAGLTLATISLEATRKSLAHILGMKEMGEDAGYRRFHATEEIGSEIDVLELKEGGQQQTEGFVHHVAWRAQSVAELAVWQKHASSFNQKVTDLKDRNYFTSIYLREPDSILHEIATDPPGFEVDEPRESLGKQLMLPKWLEEKRQEMEAALPKVN